MLNWFKKSQSWYSKKKQQSERSRYTFTIDGDLFVSSIENKEEEKRMADEKIMGKLPTGDEVRTNNYNVESYESVL